MKIRVLFFSVLKDAVGRSEIEFDCAGASSVGDVLSMLYARWPALQAWDGSVLLALDQSYVKRDEPLHDGAELAIMPPVQGG